MYSGEGFRWDWKFNLFSEGCTNLICQFLGHLKLIWPLKIDLKLAFFFFFFKVSTWLQVAEALQVQSQADIMQRELDSCLSLEYTPESLSPLLHQVWTAGHKHTPDIHKQWNRMETTERPFKPIPFLCILQFYTDRSYHLAQIKYLLMLRWRRFCRHTSIIEKLYPHYKVTTWDFKYDTRLVVTGGFVLMAPSLWRSFFYVECKGRKI